MEKDMFYVRIVGWIFDTKNRKLLIGKNHGDKNYSFLEGDLHQDEELDKCLKRIIFEKTGYKTHNLGAIYVENKLANPTKLKVHFLCEVAKGKLTPGNNVAELIWVEPKEIEKKLGVKLPSRLHEHLKNLQGQKI
jgi:ADP-ribose pyrophosphatase YjhB (NUDIX family)